MAIDPSFRLELDTATSLRDWLLNASHGDGIEKVVGESLAELAAGIDGQLHGQSEYLEISVSTTKFSPTNSSDPLDAQSNMGERDDPTGQDTSAATSPADNVSVDADHTTPSQVYNALPDTAWQSPIGEDTATSEGSSTSMTDYEQTATAAPDNNHSESENAPASQFVASYECAVCGAIQEMETSLQVCAFVDDCAACGAFHVRFSAIGIPESVHSDS